MSKQSISLTLGVNTYATITNHHITIQNSLVSWVERRDLQFYKRRNSAWSSIMGGHPESFMTISKCSQFSHSEYCLPKFQS